MGGVHEMISVIALVEKVERVQDEHIQKVLLGCDPKVWMEADKNQGCGPTEPDLQQHNPPAPGQRQT